MAFAGRFEIVSDRALAELAGFFGVSLDEVRALYYERAQTREHDGGMSHEDAERQALLDVRRQLAQQRLGQASRGSLVADDAATKKS